MKREGSRQQALRQQPRMACIDEAEFVSDPGSRADILVTRGIPRAHNP